jgi:hypothetical protein
VYRQAIHRDRSKAARFVLTKGKRLPSLIANMCRGCLVGYVLAGWIGDRLGPSTVFLLAGIVMVVLNVIPLFLRDIRALE